MGEAVAIIGQYGSGKSTLMNMPGCLDVPTEGNYGLHGIDVSDIIVLESYDNVCVEFQASKYALETLALRQARFCSSFCMEAMIITVMGGLIGIALGVLGAKGICSIAASFGMGKVEPVIEPSVILATTAFSSLIGIFFGIYPAKKAARLSPIEALRHE